MRDWSSALCPVWSDIRVFGTAVAGRRRFSGLLLALVGLAVLPARRRSAASCARRFGCVLISAVRHGPVAGVERRVREGGVVGPPSPSAAPTDGGRLGDLVLVEVSGQHGALAAVMTRAMSKLEDMGAKYHAEEGSRWRPTRYISWLGFEVDAFRGVVKLEKRKIRKGLGLREEIFEAS